MLIKDLNPLIIVSPFGWREMDQLFHPGIDIRVVDTQWIPHQIIAPETMIITEVKLSKKWGHEIKAIPVEKNDLGIDTFVFWHVAPSEDCVEDATVGEGWEIGTPEAGYVALHLHWETRKQGQALNPLLYLDMREQEYEVLT